MKGEGTCKDPRAGSGAAGRLDQTGRGSAMLVAHPPKKMKLLWL